MALSPKRLAANDPGRIVPMREPCFRKVDAVSLMRIVLSFHEGILARPHRDRAGTTRRALRLQGTRAARRLALGFDQRWEFGKRSDLAVGSTRQALRALSVAIAPHDAHAEGGGSIGVPSVRRLKADSMRIDA